MREVRRVLKGLRAVESLEFRDFLRSNFILNVRTALRPLQQLIPIYFQLIPLIRLKQQSQLVNYSNFDTFYVKGEFRASGTGTERSERRLSVLQLKCVWEKKRVFVKVGPKQTQSLKRQWFTDWQKEIGLKLFGTENKPKAVL